MSPTDGARAPVARIAMWSGPRNISTAMMRSFENRSDCAVWDEPFYAAYLDATGLAHPLRREIILAGRADWRDVAARAEGAAPGGASVFYQKHMTHHMLPDFGWGWADAVRHAFLIRAPEHVLASYAKKRAEIPLDEITLADIGFAQQIEIFDRIADKAGAAPPVLECEDVLTDPEGRLRALCAALGIAFQPAMLGWPSGPRASDGVWGAHWYDAVWRSTGFAPPSLGAAAAPLPDPLRRLADAARPIYERLAAHRLA